MFAAQVKSTQGVNYKTIKKKDYDYWKELRMPVVLFLVRFGEEFTLPYKQDSTSIELVYDIYAKHLGTVRK